MSLSARAAVFLAFGLVACAETKLYSGHPPGDSPAGYVNRWHSAYLFGTTEGSSPYDLDALCPSGWSELSVGPDFFTALAGAVTLFLYSPNRVTIVCARDERPGRPRGERAYPPGPSPIQR